MELGNDGPTEDANAVASEMTVEPVAASATPKRKRTRN